MTTDEEYVDWFANGMLTKLNKNKSKGLLCNLSGAESIPYLMKRLHEEVRELAAALGLPCSGCGRSLNPRFTDGAPKVVRECADVANFAMMVAIVAKESTS